MSRWLKRSVSLVAALALAACNLDVGQPANDPSDPTTETFAPNLKVDISTMQKTASGTFYKDVTVGGGASLTTVTAGTVVVVSYAGFIKTGQAFAQSVNQLATLNNFPFGMADGMAGMREGGERIIVVPSALGYGNTTEPGVPPNSTLIFDVILNQLP
jgi:FKBP-type peptidyl-prolyl cis-trans isomerase FkpA